MSGALMMPEEEACYVSWLGRAARVVEYGAGGSTVLAVKQRNVRHVCSIESDRAWFLQLKRRPRVRWAILRRRLSLHYVDIGPVGAWGSPIDPTAKERWPAYAQEPWLHETSPDLILVDGRFRVACVALAVIRAQPDTVIAIHDFWNRPHYHCLLPILELLERTETLGIFLPRKSGQAQALYEQHRFTQF